MNVVSGCLFCRIAAGEIPSRKVHEDSEILAFHDIHPAAPVHFLVIPKSHVDSLLTSGPEHEAVLGKMVALAPRLAKQLGCDNGF
ncbi:MAG: HIT domain-containing protein, partial [Burkholderiaceae bacterium]|nr:HIT domain-containing protein [Burkholderiaceae bacterium]